MDVVAYHEGLLPQLTALVNDHIRLVPPGWMLTQEQVAYVVSHPNAGWILHYPKDGENLSSYTLCILEDQHLTAAVNWFFTPAGEDHAKTGVMSWLVCESDHVQNLEILLGVFAAQALAQSCASITLCPRFAFGLGWFGLPDVWPYVIKSIQKLGFELDGKWVMMTAPVVALAVPVPDLPEFQFEWKINEQQLEWELYAQVGAAPAGECQAWGVPPHFRGCPGFDDWITFEWIGVEEQFQRQGLGRWLMCEQMRFQAQRNIKQVMLWVETENTPARKLYESLGFTYGPECWLFQKIF